MAGDSIGDKLKQLPPKAWVAVGICGVLLLILVKVWWPAPAPTIDPKLQEMASNPNDKEANPPVPEVAPASEGPRRKAIKK